MSLSHRRLLAISVFIRDKSVGRSTLHTSVNIMTNFNVRIIMNNVQIILINKHSYLYRFNDISLSINACSACHHVFFLVKLCLPFWGKFPVRTIFFILLFLFLFFIVIFNLFPFFSLGSLQDRILTAIFWGISHHLCRKDLTNQTASLKSWIFRS